MDKTKLLTEIELRLAELKYRLTPQREAIIIALIRNRDKHMGADELYLYTKDLRADIGLATVYRTLEILERIGVLHRLDSGDGHSRYELNLASEEHYHHHLICTECGHISEFNDDLLETIETRIHDETGFRITDHCLRFFGICRDCGK